MIVDSHCHLNFPDFREDLPQVIQRARAQGVEKFLTICTHLGEAQEIQNLADTYESIWCSVGIHPHECEKEPAVLQAQKEGKEEGLLKALKAHIWSPRVVALGETGLDFYYEESHRACQMMNFRGHILASLAWDLPLIVHTREAEAETVALLQEEGRGKVRGVIHCFTGTLDLARQCLDLGFYISFSGIVTFKNAAALREVASYVPLDRLLVETDAPYLAPVPYRGQRNEPSYVVQTLKTVADLKGLSAQALGQQTTENFLTLFSKASFEREGTMT